MPFSASAAERIPPQKHAGIVEQAFRECRKEAPCKSTELKTILKNLLDQYWKREWNHRERDFDYALKTASAHFGVSHSWLKACNRSEGGAGHWKWNGGTYQIHSWDRPRGSSGAGGPMQFKSSTYYGNITQSRGALQSVLPRRYRSGDGTPSNPSGWRLRAGQAYVAAYMFAHGDSNQWTGAGC